MEEKMMKMFMPVMKAENGKFVGILSDTSMDRDEEFMSKELLQSWAKNKSLKALANHTNKMESWVGGWRKMKTISKGRNTALVAEPWFFSKDANPLAAQIEKQVEEALANGEQPGISIGAIPKEMTDREIDGKNFRVYTKAELVEATWVPIQSNRNATFGHIAKKFDYKNDEVKNEEISKQTEDNKMVEETIIKESETESEVPEVESEAVPEVVEEAKEEVKEEEVPVEEVAEEPKEEVVEEAKEEEKVEEVVEEKPELDAQQLVNENKELKAELEKLKNEVSLKATVEGPGAVSKVNEVPEVITMETMMKARFKK